MKKETYTRITKTTGKVYFRKAIEAGRDHDLAISRAEMLRRMDSTAAGRKTRGKARLEVAEAMLEAATLVRNRRLMTPQRRKGRSLWLTPAGRGRRSAIFGTDLIPVLKDGTLEDRAEMRIKTAIRTWLWHNAGEYSGENRYVAKIGLSVDAETVTQTGDKYSRTCQYNKVDAVHTVTVKRDYWSKVIRRGLVVAGGMLTLDLEPIAHDSHTVYEAKWVRVSGKRLTVERGYIAVSGNEVTHAKTAQAACAVLTRRENQARWSRINRRIRERIEAGKLGEYAQIMVSVSDSVDAGNCKPGTLHFRDRFCGGRDEVSVAELMEIARTSSQKALVVNAILSAIRRQIKSQELRAAVA